MNWLFQLHATQPVAQAIGILALVCVAGIALGKVSVRGVRLGTSGVLFAGIVTGSFSKAVDHQTLEFVKEFGLILFVFTIGLQLGPGFTAALRRDGVRLNAVAAGIAVFGTGLAMALAWLLGIDIAGALGMLAGATTNTTSLGAAQQSLGTLPDIAADRLALPALAYAVTYPAAIVGILGTLLALKGIFHIDAKKEAQVFTEEQQRRSHPLEGRTLIVDNPNLAGVTVQAIPSREETGVIVCRYRPAGEDAVRAATGATRLQVGDSIMVMGTPAMLERFQRVVGPQINEDLRLAPGNVSDQRIVVTHKAVIGDTVGELALDARCGAVVSGLTRANVELTAEPGLRLQFGDVLHVIGDDQSLARAEALLGNSVKELNDTPFIPLFVGIVLGIIAGTVPIVIPGVPQPLQLGLAGGPLVVALILGRVGHIGRFVFYMPANTNYAFREFGIALFFAAVGLAAGPKFFGSVFSATGLVWLGAGLCVTIVPLLIAGIVARAVLHMNFTVLGGLLAGSLTDPPALAFVNNLASSEAPSLAYVTVYPMTTLLRILLVQVLALTLVH